ncbi:hypothetical protein LV89_01014 [Arcicella aurantiaca]|uniref:Uncharacterized protein n=1 Tax=Arcicella aurantiaca TaxID=591202 RepID=A0A316EHF7_9BACT|nr:hypothetical protein [Arcicella aurantiaca]PWK28233.1 hypothetical protein LV89_01014 [Arcicella aurantiaca]
MKKKIPFLLLMIALSLSSKAQSDTIQLKKIEDKVKKYDAVFKQHDSLKTILNTIKKQSNDTTKTKINSAIIDSLVSSYKSLGMTTINLIGYKLQKPHIVEDKNIPVEDDISLDSLIKHKDVLGLGTLGGLLLFISIWLIAKNMSQNSLKNRQVEWNIDKIKSFGIEIRNVEEFLIKIVTVLESESGNNKDYLLKILQGEQLDKLEFESKIEESKIITPSFITTIDAIEETPLPVIEKSELPNVVEEKIIYLSNPDTSGFFSEDTILERPDSYTYYQIIIIGESQTNPKIHFIASKNDRALKNIIDNRTKHIVPVCDAFNGYDSQKHNSINELEAGIVIKENNGWRIKNKIKIEYV